MTEPSAFDRERPILIAGPTASGKSALALDLAERHGGIVINADALQVYENWRILTARPGPQDLARAPHALYGHVAPRAAYSVGHWLREIAPLLEGPRQPIVVGGTGLYFTALTEGLAEVPEVPQALRDAAQERPLAALVGELDAPTRDRIDLANPARVRRAWEVLQATGRGLAAWQADTPPPLLPLHEAQTVLFDAPRDWLTPRIARRFDQMLTAGALDEVRANLVEWDPSRPSSRAIGAAELVAHLRGTATLEDARDAAVVATRQYAKRQRTWFRARMKGWRRIAAD